jgi:hypothetical protein
MPREKHASPVFKSQKASPDLLATVARAFVQPTANVGFDVTRCCVIEKHRPCLQRPPFMETPDEQVKRRGRREWDQNRLADRR